MFWDDIVSFVLSDAIEGGYTNNPEDPGGPTNYGITQRYLAEARRLDASLPLFVRNLTLSQAKELYRTDQWAKVQGSRLPWPVALLVFDAAVNYSPAQAIILLQRSLGVSEDGLLGDITLAAVRRRTVPELCEEYAARRAVYYAILNNKLSMFELGWMRRLFRVYTRAIS